LLGIGFELKMQPGFTHTYELVRHLEFGRHVFQMLSKTVGLTILSFYVLSILGLIFCYNI